MRGLENFHRRAKGVAGFVVEGGTGVLPKFLGALFGAVEVSAKPAEVDADAVPVVGGTGVTPTGTAESIAPRTVSPLSAMEVRKRRYRSVRVMPFMR